MSWSDLAGRTRFAVLATVRPDGSPHAVPIVHAVVGDSIVTAVDHKPKRSRQLARLANIAHEPRVTVLFDERDDAWDRLWWVRADGSATVTDDPPSELAAALVRRHVQYETRRPDGPWIVVDVHRWSGWTARP